MSKIRAARSVVIAAMLVVLLSTRAGAQLPTLPSAIQAVQDDRREQGQFAISFLAGQIVSTDWSDTVVLGSIGPGGTFEQVVVRDLGVEPGNAFEGIATYWRGRYGFRAQAAFSSSCVGAGSRCPAIDGIGVDTWFAGAGGAIRLRPYDPGQSVRPYVFGGVGATIYSLDRSIGPEFLTLVDEEPGRRTGPIVIVDDSEQFLLSVDELGLETALTASVGVGTDITLRVGGGAVGLRLEVADHISRSPVNLRLTSLEGAGFFPVLPQTRVEFNRVHHFRVTAGLVVGFGPG